ncbi:MAG: hypothetical protein LQ337_004050 [Flavoplaca oasis]|nr:MAG: hypothetical protein LQ337_004050 [Flavoplaca oasis]
MATAPTRPLNAQLVYVVKIAKYPYKFYKPHQPGLSPSHDDQISAFNLAEALRYATHTKELEELVSLLKKPGCVPLSYKMETSMKGTSDPIRKQLYARMLHKADTPDQKWECNNEVLLKKLGLLLNKASDCRGVVKHLFEDSKGRSWEVRLYT